MSRSLAESGVNAKVIESSLHRKRFVGLVSLVAKGFGRSAFLSVGPGAGKYITPSSCNRRRLVCGVWPGGPVMMPEKNPDDVEL